MLDDNITYQGKTYIMFNDFEYDDTPHHDKVGFTRGGDSCSTDNPCGVTYNNVTKEFTNENGGTNSDIKNALEEWYKTNLNDYDEQIAYGLFCNDISYGHGNDDVGLTDELYYGAYERLYSSGTKYGNPTLICPKQLDSKGQARTYGGLYKTKVGLITADELNMGGISIGDVSNQNYLRRSYSYWTATPYHSTIYAFVFLFNSTGDFIDYDTNGNDNVVPVINLKTDNISYSGTGIASDPIEIE